MKNYILIAFFILSSAGCAPIDDQSTDKKSKYVSDIIVGSAEYPDPVLDRVKELMEQGVLKDVLIMESFPVQIRLTGPASVIEELKLIPRKK